MATTNKLYVQNAAAGFTPTTKGTWNITTGAVTKGLGAKSGVAATIVGSKNVGTNPQNVLMAVFVTAPFTNNVVFSAADTLAWILGVVEDNNASNAFFQVHAWISAGQTSTVRGTLLSNFTGATEFTTTATGRGEGAQALGSVTSFVGDCLVVEIGYQGQNAQTTHTGTLNYGNTGATDLTQGSTSVTTQPGSITLVSASNPFGPLTYTIVAGALSLTGGTGKITGLIRAIAGALTLTGRTCIKQVGLIKTAVAAAMALTGGTSRMVTAFRAVAGALSLVGRILSFTNVPANRYWVGGTGTWDNSATTNWSISSGGANGASAPTSSLNVFFDGNSGGGTVTIAASTTVTGNNINFSGFTGTLAGGNSSSGMSITGDLTLGSAMTFSLTGNVNFNGGGTSQNLTTNGVAIAAAQLNALNSSSMVLQGALTTSANIGFTGSCTLTTNDHDISCVNLQTGATATTLNLGASAITLSATSTMTFSNAVINPGTSRLIFTGATGGINAAGKTFNDLEVSGSTVFSFTTSMTFNRIFADPGCTLKGVSGITVTATELDFVGDATHQITITPITAATTWTLSVASGTVSAQYCSIDHSIATGGATFNAPTTSGNIDNGNNTGWNFAAAGITLTVIAGALVLTGVAGIKTDAFRAVAGSLSLVGRAVSFAVARFMTVVAGALSLNGAGTGAASLAIDGTAHNNGFSASLTVTLTTANAGDVIVVVGTMNHGPGLSVTSPNLTFTRRAQQAALFSATLYIETWYAIAAAPLAGEVITFAQTSSDFITVDAFGVSGANTAAPFDTNGSLPAYAPSDGTDAVVSTDAANTLIFGAYRFQSASSPTEGSGFTLLSGADFQLVEHLVASSQQTSLDVTIGTGTGDNNAGIGDAIVAASGGGGVRMAMAMRAVAGALSLLGATSKIASLYRAVAGALSLVGRTVHMGANATFTAVAGALSLVGRAAKMTLSVRAVAGALSLSGRAAKIASTMRTQAGALILSGGTTRISNGLRAVAGALSLSGMTARFTSAMRGVAGSLSLTGQTVRLSFAAVFAVVAGALTLTGRTAKMASAFRAVAGTLTLTGTTNRIAAAYRAVAGSLTLTGAVVSFSNISGQIIFTVVAGALVITGQVTPMVWAMAAVAGALMLVGRTARTTSALRTLAASLTLTGGISRMADAYRAVAGSLTLIGRIARMAGTIQFILVAGAMALSGGTARLWSAMRAQAGTLSLTGGTASLTALMRAVAGALILTGRTVIPGRALTAIAGALTLTGRTIRTTMAFRAVAGALTLVGQACHTGGQIVFQVVAGALTLAGRAARLTQSLRAVAGSLTLSGAQARMAWALRASAGALVLTGRVAILIPTVAFRAVAGALVLTGRAARLTSAFRAQAGSMALSGATARLAVAYRAVAGALAFSGGVVRIAAAIILTAVAGAMTLAGRAGSMAWAFQARAGSLSLTGARARVASVFQAVAGALALAGGRVQIGSALVFTIVAGALVLTPGTSSLAAVFSVIAGAMVLLGYRTTRGPILARITQLLGSIVPGRLLGQKAPSALQGTKPTVTLLGSEPSLDLEGLKDDPDLKGEP